MLSVHADWESFIVECVVVLVLALMVVLGVAGNVNQNS